MMTTQTYKCDRCGRVRYAEAADDLEGLPVGWGTIDGHNTLWCDVCRKPVVVETGTFTGRYGLLGRHAVVDDPRYGRLYVTEEYGGEGTLDGGAYRWRHGLAIKVPAGTTLDEARKVDWHDPRVPLVESLCGEHLARYVEALGL